ncbi:hypothetical protein RJI07_07685 [Mycoplasmatota bacterium WC30]
MFRILQDSIFNPKGLVRQVNRSGWYVFFHIMIMAIFMSIGSFVAQASHNDSLMNYQTTGCRLEDSVIICDGENYDIDNLFYIQGIRVYFLEQDVDIHDVYIPDQISLVIQGNTAKIYIGQMQMGDLKVFNSGYELASMEEGLDTLGTAFLITTAFSNILGNIILILMIILVSTLMFLRYKQEINYKKIFKLVTFAVTPVALLITFFNLIAFDPIIFFILTIFAYRSLFILNRELYMQIILRRIKKAEKKDDVVETYNSDDFEEDNSSDEEDDEQ